MATLSVAVTTACSLPALAPLRVTFQVDPVTVARTECARLVAALWEGAFFQAWPVKKYQLPARRSVTFTTTEATPDPLGP